MNEHKSGRRVHFSRSTVLLLAVQVALFVMLQGGGVSNAASAKGQGAAVLNSAGSVAGAAGAQGQAAPAANCAANGQCFADVLPNNPFYAFINRIYQQDLVSGYACGGPGEPCDSETRPYYRPNSNITRSQMAKFIDNARHLPGIDIQTNSNINAINVVDTSPTGTGVYASGGIAGFYGNSDSGSGVQGTATSGDGVYGNSTMGAGVYGYSEHEGVHGESTNGTGVYGKSTSGWAGYYQGSVNVTGGCCYSGEATTRIDDPVDPANKYLTQSLVQSPDMTTVLNGNVTTDAKNEATVSLPAWFEASNKDFRYQLTAIGQFAQAIVAQEVNDNVFVIKTDKPNVKVSWQVTGVRQDAYAKAHPIQAEQVKPDGEKGKYLYPAENGQPDTLGVGYDNQQQTQQTQQAQQAKQGSQPKP